MFGLAGEAWPTRCVPQPRLRAWAMVSPDIAAVSA